MAATKKAKAAAAAKEPKDVMDVLTGLSQGMTDMLAGMGELRNEINEVKKKTDENAVEINRVKTGDKDAFKLGAKQEDIEKVAAHRKNIDPRIVAIVDELLGTDFGIEMTALDGERIGNMFTLIVPERLNDNPIEQRPVLEAPGVYRRDALGNVVMENYQRPDRRSRMLASADGYSAIREHCEKVRAFMHAYYNAKGQPMPKLNVKG